MICAYCHEPRDNPEDWHGCEPSLRAKARVEQLIGQMSRIAYQSDTSIAWEPTRKKRIEDMAQQVKLQGGKVKDQI